MELQSQYDELKRRGMGLAAISYDPVETLAKFSSERGITFPLISDPASAIIKRYGLFNTTVEPGTRAYGVPFPGTFMLDRRRVVRSRHFEDAYQERNTAASILVREGAAPFGPAMSVETRHLRLTAGLSDAAVTPGTRLSITFDIEPRPGMHVYAPGKHSYQVISVTLAPEPWFKVAPLTYPASEMYHFVPLDEHIEVYVKPFRLMRDITILATPEARKLLAAMKTVTITGTVSYQACDDSLCYAPQSVPVKWMVPIR